jgi:hypothetical protein
VKKTFQSSKKPGQRARFVIEERSYKTTSDRRRAMTILDKYWRRKGLATVTVFTIGNDDDGNPRLYLSRAWTLDELAAAGFTPADFNYSDHTYSWRVMQK